MTENLINISFDLDEAINSFSLNRQQIEELNALIIRRLSEDVIFNWRRQADNHLSKTRQNYKRNIKLIEITDKHSVIALLGSLNNMIESGAPAFDIKIGMSKSPKRKVKKGNNAGWYITVPFRWATPFALGENEAFSNVMPLEVYEIAKNLETATSEPGKNRKVVYGERIVASDLSKNLRTPKTRPAYGSFGSYTHKSSIYEGIIREEKTYEKATQYKYYSFRRVSDLSDANSWIHPGFVAKNLAEKAIDSMNVDAIVNFQLNKYLQSL